MVSPYFSIVKLEFFFFNGDDPTVQRWLSKTCGLGPLSGIESPAQPPWPSFLPPQVRELGDRRLMWEKIFSKNFRIKLSFFCWDNNTGDFSGIRMA